MDLGGINERPALEEGPPRPGGESLDSGAASRHQPLSRWGAKMGSANLAGKQEGAREEVQHQGAECDFVRPWVTPKKARPAGVIGRQQ